MNEFLSNIDTVNTALNAGSVLTEDISPEEVAGHFLEDATLANASLRRFDLRNYVPDAATRLESQLRVPLKYRRLIVDEIFAASEESRQEANRQVSDPVFFIDMLLAKAEVRPNVLLPYCGSAIRQFTNEKPQSKNKSVEKFPVVKFARASRDLLTQRLDANGGLDVSDPTTIIALFFHYCMMKSVQTNVDDGETLRDDPYVDFSEVSKEAKGEDDQQAVCLTPLEELCEAHEPANAMVEGETDIMGLDSENIQLCNMLASTIRLQADNPSLDHANLLMEITQTILDWQKIGDELLVDPLADYPDFLAGLERHLGRSYQSNSDFDIATMLGKLGDISHLISQLDVLQVKHSAIVSEISEKETQIESLAKGGKWAELSQASAERASLGQIESSLQNERTAIRERLTRMLPAGLAELSQPANEAEDASHEHKEEKELSSASAPDAEASSPSKEPEASTGPEDEPVEAGDALAEKEEGAPDAEATKEIAEPDATTIPNAPGGETSPDHPEGTAESEASPTLKVDTKEYLEASKQADETFDSVIPELLNRDLPAIAGRLARLTEDAGGRPAIQASALNAAAASRMHIEAYDSSVQSLVNLASQSIDASRHKDAANALILASTLQVSLMLPVAGTRASTFSLSLGIFGNAMGELQSTLSSFDFSISPLRADLEKPAGHLRESKAQRTKKVTAQHV